MAAEDGDVIHLSELPF